MDHHLEIKTLGGLQIKYNDTPVTGLATRKVEALLVYLALNPHEHPREVLANLLWDDLPQERTLGNLRNALTRLQKQLAPFLTVTRQVIGINTATRITIDLLDLRNAISQAESYWESQGSFSVTIASQLQPTLELYQGDFLEGFQVRNCHQFQGWVILQHESIRHQVVESLNRLCEFIIQQRRFSDGIMLMKRSLELDPLSEKTHRYMMQLLALSGQRSAAIEQYKLCETLLQDELAIDPDADTVDLYEDIRAGKFTNNAHNQIPNNLPKEETPLVNREADLEQMAQQFTQSSCRLLTLTGEGGVGKTRLAIQFARRHLHEFRDGVYFISLLHLSNATIIPSRILETLGIENDEHLESPLLQSIADKNMLLILDGFESLIDGAQHIHDLLQFALRIKTIVTSRQRLNLQSEHLYHVSSFPITADPTDAIQLFDQTARRTQPNFSLDENITNVLNICATVEGNPLAIEIAASLTRILSCKQIAELITSDYKLLATNLSNVPQRHRSIKAVFDDSWSRLTIDEQQVLYQLAQSNSILQQDAVQMVGDKFSILLSLIDQSLVQVNQDQYRLSSLFRQYTLEQFTS